MKKLFPLALALVLSVSLLTGVSAAAATENGEASGGETVWYGDGAWGVLAPHIYNDSEIIRDDFAGAWVEPGREDYVYIAVTEDADMDFYNGILADRSDFEFVFYKYSLKDLRLLQNSVFERCKDIMSGAGASEKGNVVFFWVRVDEETESGRIAAAMKAVKEENNLPDGIENAFTVEYGVNVKPVAEEEDEEIGVNVPTEGKTSNTIEESVK